jgi:hypothetical protein
MKNYIHLLRRYGSLRHGLSLAVCILLIAACALSFVFEGFSVFSLLWGGVGVVGITSIGSALKKKEEAQAMPNDMGMPAATPEAVPAKKTFGNYFPGSLLIINIALAIYWGSLSDLGMGGIFLMVHWVIIAYSAPLAIFAFMGKAKRVANVSACILLLPVILLWAFFTFFVL